VNAYGLLVEPWIFVIDRDGVVRASFEAVVSEQELRAAIDAVK
jgi:peroxiredoxin